MRESYTAGASRAIQRAEVRARRRGATVVEPVDLLAALADEPESRASTWLTEFGLDPDSLLDSLGFEVIDPEEIEAEPDEIGLPSSEETRAVFAEATLQAKAFDRGQEVGTEHLLAGLATRGGETVMELLSNAGIDPDILAEKLGNAPSSEHSPIPLASDFTPLDLSEPGQGADLGRIMDASANRAREGLRVVEDYVRFALNDPGLTRRLKLVRHRLADALAGLDPAFLIAARDTTGDVGTHIMTANEQARENPRAVVTANFKRTAEALRSLEEYGKLINVWLSGRFEVLRYDVYTLEKLVLTAIASNRLLGDARLMVLVGGLATLGDLTWVVGEALQGGAQVIQLREKNIDDREWLRRAREVRILTAQAKAKFIVNDRVDMALLSRADGVHLGQDDISVRDARRIVGPSVLVGVSTHNRAQIERAVLDGASYLGVGPVFPSTTKSFDDFAGLQLVSEASELTNIPWFAIGGINTSTVDEVIASGATRVAVSAGVVQAEFPRRAARAIRDQLEAIEI